MSDEGKIPVIDSEAAFVTQIRRELAGEFWIESVEQRHSRGFPDLVLIDLMDPISYALTEVKVADSNFYDLDELGDKPITIKSLKPHQINWLESRCKVGGHIRPGIGMLLLVAPMIFYVRGDKVARWRKKPAPNYLELHDIGTWIGHYLHARLLRSSIYDVDPPI
jgi:hypothetical protein